ncbi:MAG TPA: VOC family protein [Amycolatopsis sp.]|jgi:catechol 2,3-dioxygenase-like lactoylglutathione lyase family enzyme
MLATTTASATFAVRDLAAAKEFYGDVLGLRVAEAYGGAILQLHLAGGMQVLVYAKQDHTPAAFTLLTFHVEDLRAVVAELAGKGVKLERPDGLELDDEGILHAPGHDAAWFTDPSGNTISLTQNRDS